MHFLAKYYNDEIRNTKYEISKYGSHRAYNTYIFEHLKFRIFYFVLVWFLSMF
ncbi:hypothetical protein KsCSTR_41610 [Candidatus Kuenenia stuttgartiensis]|uniref:Uncharacterized protein n=1 Tax=Kuenenia stuttgartiensis TaxID=174633 RepID=Q1PXL5_KUEST|nr:hypothetical protein KsCSTR_41610 [Candidatus Kuenenia stuttgartiensis]CAJ71974.1 unknown protein [Candidatus Kuenenia stuttgartiensis]